MTRTTPLLATRIKAAACVVLAVALILTGCRTRPPASHPLTRDTPVGSSSESEVQKAESNDDPLESLNLAFRQTYAASRLRTLAAEGPVILAIGDDLILVRADARKRAKATPALFHDLKSIAHLPLAIHVALSDAEGMLRTDSLRTLETLRALSERARQVAAAPRFPEEQVARQLRILDRSRAFLDQVLRNRRAKLAETNEYARALAPDIMENVRAAAWLQIEGYDRVVKAWRVELGEAEWARAKAIVSGSQLPRSGALPVQYFAHAFGVPGEGRRIIYAESTWNEDKALKLLGTHVLDRRTSIAFFNDEDRMHRDILADAAAEILKAR